MIQYESRFKSFEQEQIQKKNNVNKKNEKILKKKQAKNEEKV